MDPRTKIPALALLGLTCTDCSDRAGADPLVGSWLAVDIDGDVYPLVDEVVRSGWQLDIDEDQRGRLTLYSEEMDDGAVTRFEYYADLMVDDVAAPKYRITVDSDLTAVVGDGDYSESYAVTTRAEDGDSYDVGSGTGTTDLGTDGDDSAGYDSDALDPDERSFDEFEPGLADNVRPIARGRMILDCELTQQVLHCERMAPAGEDLRRWQLARKPA